MFVKRFPVIGILLALALIATACAAVPAAETAQEGTAGAAMDSERIRSPDRQAHCEPWILLSF